VVTALKSVVFHKVTEKISWLHFLWPTVYITFTATVQCKKSKKDHGCSWLVGWLGHFQHNFAVVYTFYQLLISQ